MLKKKVDIDHHHSCWHATRKVMEVQKGI